jgi:hypothetical protein
MKKLILIFVTIVLIMSCEKYDNTCNCNNPLEYLAWLKELKDSFTNCTCEISIVQGTYEKQTVFCALPTDPVCDVVFNINIYDCKGTVLKNYTNNFEIFDNEVTNRKVLYRCKTK